MGGRHQPPPETEEQRTAKQIKKDQKIAIKTADRSAGGGKAGAVQASELDSQARNRRLSIGGGSGYSGGGGSSMSGAQGGRIGANIP